MARLIPGVFVPLLAMLAVLVSATAAASSDPLAELDEAIESARVQWHAPGLAVAIVKDDRVVYAKGFGTKHVGQNDPVDAHTLFTLASTSKAFVATALGILVEDGQLGWDDPVIRHIPEFRVADPYVTREVTVRDLLVHRTGIEEMDILWVRGFGIDQALEQMRNARQVSSLRSTWAYSNAMYMVAAEVVARVAGKSFEDLVTERIFTPAGMSESMFTGPALATRANVTGFHLIEQGVARRSEPYLSAAPLGAAGIQSSATDMGKWLQLLLNEGNIGGKQVVKRETIAETLKPQMLLSSITYPAAQEATPHFFAYGLGWFLQDYKGRLLAMHTGSLYGANSIVAIVPEEKLGLVMLVNADPVQYRHAFMYDVIDRFIGNRSKDWNADLWDVYSKLDAEANAQRAGAIKARPANTKPSASLQAYTGRYSNPVAGEVEVIAKKDGKLALLMKPDGVFSLSHWSYDTFEASDDRAPEDTFLITFARDAEGKITRYDTPNGRTYRREAAPAK